MSLQLLIGTNGERYLATTSGDILAEFGACNEFTEVTMLGQAGQSVRAKVVLEGLAVSYLSDNIVDGSVVSSHALPEPMRALPAAPQDSYDFDPYDYEDFPRDDEEDDFMEGLCPDCVQELCLRCGQCKTPACEAENCDCP